MAVVSEAGARYSTASRVMAVKASSSEACCDGELEHA